MPSLLSSLYTGVSGLQANSEAMGILGDNISNVNTVGFKSSRAVFSDLFSTILANGSTTRQLGRGSNLLSSLKDFSQGAFESSSNALDMALDGSGFFVINNGTGNQYTRAGQFRMNENGLVQTVTGGTLQGQKIENGVVSAAEGAALEVGYGDCIEGEAITIDILLLLLYYYYYICFILVLL